MEFFMRLISSLVALALIVTSSFAGAFIPPEGGFEVRRGVLIRVTYRDKMFHIQYCNRYEGMPTLVEMCSPANHFYREELEATIESLSQRNSTFGRSMTYFLNASIYGLLSLVPVVLLNQLPKVAPQLSQLNRGAQLVILLAATAYGLHRGDVTLRETERENFDLAHSLLNFINSELRDGQFIELQSEQRSGIIAIWK